MVLLLCSYVLYAPPRLRGNGDFDLILGVVDVVDRGKGREGDGVGPGLHHILGGGKSHRREGGREELRKVMRMNFGCASDVGSLVEI